eukprot:m.261587 g.261587  ORF g.261587 m.261587 type:complete len:454 (+) comp54613_c0_seq2:103-1464(+)
MDTATLQPAVDMVSENIGKLVIPMKKRLTSIEAERIVAVLDTAIQKTELVAIFSDAQQHMPFFEKILDGPSLDLLREHIRCEKAYVGGQRAVTPRGSRDEPEKPLMLSTRSLLRHFLRAPAALHALRAQNFQITPQMRLFLYNLKSLRQLAFDQLLTTVAEETEKQEHLAGLLARERKLANEVKKLETDLEDAQRAADEEFAKNEHLIEKLMSQVDHIQSTSAEVNKRIEKESQRRQEAELQSFQTRKAEIEVDINSLTKDVSSQQFKHRESEAALRKRLNKIENEVENWIAKYDNDMFEKQQELEEVQKQFSQEQQQLTELEKKFAELEVEYNAILEERRIQREKREAAEREVQMMVKAALLIQAYWRGLKVRRALKAKTSKSSAKGKKGKSSSAKGSKGDKPASAKASSTKPSSAASTSAASAKPTSALSVKPTSTAPSTAPSSAKSTLRK